jgi:hypothetical protein
MPIVPGNEPPRRRQRGSALGWLLPLLIFGPTIYNVVRNNLGINVSNQQALIVVGGIVGLVALAVIVQRVNRLREGNTTTLPTSYTPPHGKPYVPSAPRFEPIVTGKVVLAGFVLALLIAGFGAVLLLL